MHKIERLTTSIGYGVRTVWAAAEIAMIDPRSPLFGLNPFTATIKQVDRSLHGSLRMPESFGSILKQAAPGYYQGLKDILGETAIDIDKVYQINAVREGEELLPLLVYIDGKENTPPRYFIGTEDMADNNGFDSYQLVLQAIQARGGKLYTDVRKKR